MKGAAPKYKFSKVGALAARPQTQEIDTILRFHALATIPCFEQIEFGFPLKSEFIGL